MEGMTARVMPSLTACHYPNFSSCNRLRAPKVRKAVATGVSPLLGNDDDRGSKSRHAMCRIFDASYFYARFHVLTRVAIACRLFEPHGADWVMTSHHGRATAT